MMMNEIVKIALGVIIGNAVSDSVRRIVAHYEIAQYMKSKSLDDDE